MNRLMRTLAELTKEMREQECYKKYQECLKSIKEDEKLYAQLNDYRRRNVEIHLNHKTLKEEADLEKEVHGLLMKEPVREFLYWEHKTTEMIRHIHEEVEKGMDLDLSFF